MKIKTSYLVWFLPLVFLTSCIDEYWPDLTRYDNLLVVDGVISNGDGPCSIKLSFSSDVNYPRYIAYRDCQVTISTGSGQEYNLNEEKPGTYLTEEGVFSGIPGEQYKLTVQTPDGRIYESPWETMLHPVEIDSVYAAIEYRQTDTENHDLVGYQFYLDTKSSTVDSTYFWWSLEETYQYNADFTLEYLYAGSIQPFPNWDTLFTCWRTSQIPEIFISNTNDLISPRIEKFPLQYVDTESRRLSVRYSLLIDQYTINRQVYEYWENLKTQIEEDGSLYSSQPFQVRGNMVNIDDPDEPVLGYFIVAGKSSKRIYVDRPWGELFYYTECEPVFDMGLGFTRPWQWPIYITTIDGVMATAGKSCFDCTSKGGTTEKPEFWEDY
jgi:hypothetical protein